MAIKPSFAPRVWDSSGIYTTGPFIGNVSRVDPGAGIAAEGHRPGSSFPTAAEHENDQQWKISKYVAEWLALGSSTGAADAHIVETNALGRATLHGLDVNDTADETAVSITGITTIAPLVSLSCTTGATVTQADIGVNTGIGYAIDITDGEGRGFVCNMFGGLAAARGLYISADSTSASTCVELIQDGTKNAISIVASGGSSAINIEATGSGGGVNIDCSTGSGGGATITGNASASALYVAAGTGQNAGQFVGAGTSTALSVTGGAGAGSNAADFLTDNSTGIGVYSRTNTTATTAARAGYFEGRDQAAGIEVVSANYSAIRIQGEVTSPVYAPIYVVGQTSLPTNFGDGTLTHYAPGGSIAPMWAVGSGAEGYYRGIWDSPGGFAFGMNHSIPTTNSSTAAYTTLCTVTISGANAPRVSGFKVRLQVTMRVGNTSGSAVYCDVQIRDTTAPATLITRAGAGQLITAGYPVGVGTGDYSDNIAFDIEYTIPAVTAARTFVLEFKRNQGVGNLIAQGSLVITGSYNS